MQATPRIPLISIVDDDVSVRKSLERLIRSAGMRVCVFASAEEFLNSARPRKADCLILDVQLPGMSGTELFRQLNMHKYKVPVIFITAHGDEKMRMQALRAGAVEFVAKPFDDEALVESVRAALES